MFGKRKNRDVPGLSFPRQQGASKVTSFEDKNMEHGENHDEVDGFATVRSVLAQLIPEEKMDLAVSQEQQKEQIQQQENHNSGKDRSMRMQRQIETENKSICGDTREPECFSFQNFTDDSGYKNCQENDDDDNTGKTNYHNDDPSSDRIQCQEKPKHRSRKSSTWHELVESRPTSPSSFALSLTKSRKSRTSDMTRRQNVPPRLSSRKSNSQYSNERDPMVTKVGSVRCIVGLRPTHWNKDERSHQKRSFSGTEIKAAQGLAKASTLAAATRVSFQRPNQTRKRTVGNSNMPAEFIINSHTYSSSNTKNTARTPFENAKSSCGVIEAPFSFTPSFVPTKSIPLLHETIGDDSGDESLVLPRTMDNSSACTTFFKRRRRSKASTGEWVRRLIAFHNTRNTNSLRLQNKALAHKRMLLDVTDPRKRTKTYTDVTILGQYNGPWINVPENMKITVLGYAHCHMQRIKNGITKNQQREEATNTISGAFFAWLTFTLVTARRIELDKGCKLRIYDAIILPRSQSLALDVPSKMMSFMGNKMKTGTNSIILCEKTIICTDVCEKLISVN